MPRFVGQQQGLAAVDEERKSQAPSFSSSERVFLSPPPPPHGWQRKSMSSTSRSLLSFQPPSIRRLLFRFLFFKLRGSRAYGDYDTSGVRQRRKQVVEALRVRERASYTKKRQDKKDVSTHGKNLSDVFFFLPLFFFSWNISLRFFFFCAFGAQDAWTTYPQHPQHQHQHRRS